MYQAKLLSLMSKYFTHNMFLGQYYFIDEFI